MRAIWRGALLATILAIALTPLASADSTAWRARTLDCGPAGTLDFLLPPAEYNTAFVPLHEATGTRVLTILEISVDGTTYISRPLAAKGGARLTTCGYTDPASLVIEITGILTPAT